MSIVISVTKSFAIIWSVLTASGPLLFTGNGALGGFQEVVLRLLKGLWAPIEGTLELLGGLSKPL